MFEPGPITTCFECGTYYAMGIGHACTMPSPFKIEFNKDVEMLEIHDITPSKEQAVYETEINEESLQILTDDLLNTFSQDEKVIITVEVINSNKH